MYLCSFRSSIDNRCVDGYPGMMPLDGRHAFGRGHDTNHPDTCGARALQQIECGNRAAAGGEHRVDHQDEAGLQIRRKLGVVPRRGGGHLVALKPDVADARVGHELQNRVEHPEPRPQHRHDDHVRADLLSGRRTERRVDADVAVRDLAHRFGGEQHADPRGRSTKMFRHRSLVAQLDERIVHERMLDDVDRHGPHYTISPSCVHRTRRDRSSEGQQSPVARSPVSSQQSPVASRQSPVRLLCVVAVVLGAVALATGQQRRPATLIITGGIVVTQNAARQVLNPGAVAIDRHEHRSTSIGRKRSRRGTPRPRRSTRAVRSSCPA